jgi:hypothetical protein
MEQNPFWEVDERLPGQEMHSFLWNPTVHYRVHKNSPLELILSQFNPVHALKSYSVKISSLPGIFN